ncbi:MAG: hypothetical protein IJP78_09670 [Clostridia bacterium]|nr:hypothetical protein [Clostridia bacterium]
MKQENIAWIILDVMGLSMPLLPPKTLWKITDQWKTKGDGEPSNKYKGHYKTFDKHRTCI